MYKVYICEDERAIEKEILKIQLLQGKINSKSYSNKMFLIADQKIRIRAML